MSKSNHYTGLSAREVEESRARHGVNVLTPPAKMPLWKRFLEKFEDPIIIILLIAGVFSLLISCYEFFCDEQCRHGFLRTDRYFCGSSAFHRFGLLF